QALRKELVFVQAYKKSLRMKSCEGFFVYLYYVEDEPTS
ncbi:MAG: hypothetical protein RJA04_695, partial [Bacteroidota bacterium]